MSYLESSRFRKFYNIISKVQLFDNVNIMPNGEWKSNIYLVFEIPIHAVFITGLPTYKWTFNMVTFKGRTKLCDKSNNVCKIYYE